MKLKEGGKVFPVGGNVARKVHRNDNPHLDRLHPPQMEELVAQMQVCFLLMTPYSIWCLLYSILYRVSHPNGDKFGLNFLFLKTTYFKK